MPLGLTQREELALVGRVALALADGETPERSDVEALRGFVASVANGQHKPEAWAEYFAQKKQGCSCKVKIMVGSHGSVGVEHEPGCWLLTPESKRLDPFAPPQPSLADSPRGRFLDRVTGAGRR
jgi:hypothetical protein